MLDAYLNPFDFAACPNYAAVVSTVGVKWTLMRSVWSVYSSANALNPPSQCAHFQFSLQLVWILRSVLFDLYILGEQWWWSGIAGMAQWWDGSSSANLVLVWFLIWFLGWFALICFRTVPGQCKGTVSGPSVIYIVTFCSYTSEEVIVVGI